MSVIIHGTVAGWAKATRNRKWHAVTIHASGFGKGDKSLDLTLVRERKGVRERLDLVITGTESIAALMELCRRTLASNADVITDLTSTEHLGTPLELEQPPVTYRVD